jgi:hypothetical protein
MGRYCQGITLIIIPYHFSSSTPYIFFPYLLQIKLIHLKSLSLRDLLFSLSGGERSKKWYKKNRPVRRGFLILAFLIIY